MPETRIGKDGKVAVRYRSAILGHNGFPDLTVAKDRRCFHFEVKGESGYPTEEQLAWLVALPNSYLVKPRDFAQCANLLQGLAPTAITSLRFEDGRWVGNMADWAAKRYPHLLRQ